MATAATKLMTADEFYDWVHQPENRDRVFELERGEIVELAREGKRHGFVCANVTGILRNFVHRRKKGYVCSNNTGVVVERDPDTVRGPDILLFEDTTKAEEINRKYGEQPPVLAVEVLSPNDKMSTVLRRVREQLRFGTRLVWVVDPEECNVIVYRPGREEYLVGEGEELTGEEVLPDFRGRVVEFFVLPGQGS